jgi:hypothetical protein
LEEHSASRRATAAPFDIESVDHEIANYHEALPQSEKRA